MKISMEATKIGRVTGTKVLYEGETEEIDERSLMAMKMSHDMEEIGLLSICRSTEGLGSCVFVWEEEKRLDRK